jgi:hypothetical protein
MLLGVDRPMPARARALLGLSVPEIKAGRRELRAATLDFAYALVGDAAPADPAELWSHGPDIDRVAARWIGKFGRRASIPDEVLAAAARELKVEMPITELIQGIADPTGCEWLTTNKSMELKPGGIYATGSGFDRPHLSGVVAALSWLAYRLPVGDPVRTHLATAFDLVNERIADPGHMVYVTSARDPKAVHALLGVEPIEHNVRVNDWLAMRLVHTYVHAYVRPGLLTAADEPLFEALVALMDEENGFHRDRGLLSGPGFRAACAARAPEGTDPGRYFQDPTLSVPDLVAEVAARHGLGADAATLYLQLLALPDPTDANVTRWNGWTAARRKAAVAELAGTDLVLTAKRARAGRSLFLPGGWLGLSAPLVPLEEWKLPMLACDDKGRPRRPVVPLRPVADQFRLAWQRVLDGDPPRYTELRTGAGR